MRRPTDADRTGDVRASPSRSRWAGNPLSGNGPGVILVAMLILSIVTAALAALYHVYVYGPKYRTPATFVYAHDGRAEAGATPADGCHPGRGGIADHQAMVTNAVRFTVTTPANYRADRAHPLLMVWAPSGFSAGLSEKFTGLTNAATANGFVIAYVRSVPLGFNALQAMAGIPEEIARNWCIDSSKIFYSGHSDGGTVSNALAVLPERHIQPRAIAPSAMGMQDKDMALYACPVATAVMLMHNQGDGHFPGYGAGVARWWARCNGCRDEAAASHFPGCVEYQGCSPKGRTLFCQARGNHAHWPGFDHDVIRFFTEIAAQDR